MKSYENKIIHTHLYSQNCLLREKAANFLAKTDSSTVAKKLISEFKNKNRYVAIRAAWGLRLMKEKIVVPLLAEALSDPAPEICRNTGWALNKVKGKMAEEAAAEVFLKSADSAVQNEAATALRGKETAKNPEVQKKLIEILKRDKGSVTSTLGDTRTPEAMTALSDALKIKDFPSKNMALLRLARAKDKRAFNPAVKMLKKNVWGTASWALELLEDCRALPFLIDYANRLKTAKGFNTFHSASKAIESAKRSTAVEFLLPLLKSKDYRVRLSGAMGLGAAASNKAIGPLTKMLNDKHWLVRGTAAETLGIISGTKTVAPLIRALRDRSWYVRKNAAGALGKIKSPEAVPVLLKAFEDKNILVQINSAQALAEIGDPEAENKMMKGFKIESPLIRDASRKFFAKLKLKKAVPLLLKDLSDEFWSAKAKAAETLGEIGDRRAVKPLKRLLKDNSAEVYLAAEKALKRINEPAPTDLKHIFGCKIQ